MTSRSRGTILLVDDERAVLLCLGDFLEEAGYRVLCAGCLRQARTHLVSTIDMAFVDQRLPDGLGIDLLREIHEGDASVPVIMLTGHTSVSDAVTAMKAGAFDYVEKPVDVRELGRLVEHALSMRHSGGLTTVSGRKPKMRPCSAAIVGQSPQMSDVADLVTRIAASPGSTVLVTGESGTGKDLVARAIHSQSSRVGGPFLNITCSALPGPLLESELFGHERGAFTDAKQRKVGLIEHAAGGTVFLDEIGELELPLQAKLLRFLEDKTFRRVGGKEAIRADVRVVAATNVDLLDAVRTHRFREDLYYRLAVLMIRLPALRERLGDPEHLAMHFVARFNKEFGRSVNGLDDDALELIRTYPWPGNVRELKNAMERAVLLTKNSVLTRGDFDTLSAASIDDVKLELPAEGVDMRELERSLVLQALERTSGNRTRAAKLLGMNRDQIRYRIEHFGLEPERHEAKH